ncbi:hypothetical protein BD410DRAFT_178701 [Rickenella mellea]|uniref:Uncharacterized protein n=1 Tax=Rickenella mellea TaxID=50990 RepID=A0A4Y7Q885_9AGAM|nr:hypothetical protein BD410DRAFT_178701 [Rickenella mellea]
MQRRPSNRHDLSLWWAIMLSQANVNALVNENERLREARNEVCSLVARSIRGPGCLFLATRHVEQIAVCTVRTVPQNHPSKDHHPNISMGWKVQPPTPAFRPTPESADTSGSLPQPQGDLSNQTSKTDRKQECIWRWPNGPKDYTRKSRAQKRKAINSIGG